LTRLLRAAEDGGRIGSVIDTLVLLALAHDARGDIPAALEALERALVLAQPEGYVRVFVQAGPPVAGLLRRAAQRGPAETYARKLISHFDQADPKPTDSNGLVEPLSDRELDVLRLLATDLSGPDIARHLVVSLHTVRTHTKNIYAKLGVNNRRAAVRTAEELHLLQ
jgi:LuxR family maltose regulon positive regulatory protein